jgi:hypothetical protein
MATLSTTSLNWLAREWEKQYKSAVLSGIVGDLAHKARGGYHISRQDQGSGNYSVTRPDDKLGPSDRASAIDMTMSTADMKKCHVRLRDIWKNRAKDPRMKYINAWNGWDGVGGAGRYDIVKGTVGTATADHKWHIHLEIRRRYVNDMTAMKAILSMLKGESLATYQGTGSSTTPPPTNVKGDTNVSSADVITALKSTEGQKLVADAAVAALLRDGVVVNEYVGSKETNPSLAAATTFKNIAVIDQKLSSLATVVAGLADKLDLDEASIASSLASNTAFVEALATRVAESLPIGVDITPEELTNAVKTALRDGVAS